MSGQGSKEWHDKRAFCWTGSTNKKLTSLGKKLTKAEGGGSGEHYKWGQAAKTAIFNMFLRRLTGQYVVEEISNAAMDRGHELEPLAISRFEQEYPHLRVMLSEELVSTGFMLNPDSEGRREFEDGFTGQNGTSGSSQDGVVIDCNINKIVAALECKARGEDAANAHAYAEMDNTHDDYIQCLSHTIPLNVNKTYYLNIDDRLDPPYDLKVRLIEFSDVEKNWLLQRQLDADKMINQAIKKVGDVSLLSPEERTKKICEIRKWIYNNKEV